MRTTLVKEPRRRRGSYLVPNLFTTGNLFSGLYAILAVFNGQHMVAAIAILVALVFDVLDGKSARWMNGTSQFGVEYDSLADLVSFGVAPGILIYSYALGTHGMAGMAVMFAFVACGALRLARFNVIAPSSEGRYFLGLPIPAAASVVAALIIFDRHVLQMGRETKPVLILVLTLMLAFLMVSTVKYRSFKDLTFKPGRHFNHLVWAILGLMLVAAWPQVMLFVAFVAYAALGPVEKAVSLCVKGFGKRGVSSSEQPVQETKD